MSNYYVRRSNEYLEHSWADVKRGIHKYITKIQRGGKTVYIYTQQQLANLRKGVSGAVSNVRRKIEDASGITAKNRMRVNKLRSGALTYRSKKAQAHAGEKGYTRHIELSNQANKADKNAKRYEQEYKKSLVGKLDSVSKFFKPKSRTQKKHLKRLTAAGNKGRKNRLKEDPNYLQRGLSINGSTPELRIKEKKIREKRTYEEPRRDRLRRGGKPYAKRKRRPTVNGKNIRTWEKAEKKPQVQRW